MRRRSGATKLMANTRTAARSFGKSDPIDALAVARAGLREPICRSPTWTRRARAAVLADHRDDLVGERTHIDDGSSLHLHELGPGSEPPLRTLAHLRTLDRLATVLRGRMSRGLERAWPGRCHQD